MQRRTLVGALASAAMLLGGCSDSDDQMFVAELSSANEVPPVSSGATGSAGFTIQDDDTIHYSLSVSGTTAVTGAHIHTGSANENGGIVVVLFPEPGGAPFGDPTGPLDGFLTSGSFTAADLDGISFGGLVDAMQNGQVYVNVHNQEFRPGVVRGQIRPVR